MILGVLWGWAWFFMSTEFGIMAEFGVGGRFMIILGLHGLPITNFHYVIIKFQLYIDKILAWGSRDRFPFPVHSN